MIELVELKISNIFYVLSRKFFEIVLGKKTYFVYRLLV